MNTNGQLRNRADIHYWQKTGVDARGNPIKVDTVLYSGVPCSINTLTGRELELAREQVQEADTKFVSKYLPNIDATMWFVFQGQKFQIGWINNPNQTNRWNEYLTSRTL